MECRDRVVVGRRHVGGWKAKMRLGLDVYDGNRDRIAIRAGTWSIAEGTSLNIFVWKGLPIE